MSWQEVKLERRSLIHLGIAGGISMLGGFAGNKTPVSNHEASDIQTEPIETGEMTLKQFSQMFDEVFDEGLKLPTSKKYGPATKEKRGDTIEGDVLFHEGEWTNVKIRRGVISTHIQGLPQDNVANDGKPRSFRSILISTFRKDNSRYPSTEFYSGSVIFILDDHKPRITKFELEGNDPKDAKIIEDRELTMEELKQIIKELKEDLEEEKFKGVTDPKL